MIHNTSTHSDGLIGIDIGTGMIKIAIPDIGGPKVLSHPDGNQSVPSAACFASDEPEFGHDAVNRGYASPECLVREAKRHLGTDDPLAVDHEGKPVTARIATTVLIGYAIACYEKATGRIPNYAVICIPANFTEPQRKAIIETARANGLEVLRLVHEPTAAALGNQLQKRAPGSYMIIDIGHGTTDVSVVDVAGNTVTVLAANGVPRLGGMDFADRLTDRVLNAFAAEHGRRPDLTKDPVFAQDLSERVDQAKKSLSVRDATTVAISYEGHISTIEVTRAEYEEVIRDLIDQVMDCAEQTLQEKNTAPDDLKGILAVGGPASMPIVHAEIKARFGLEPLAHCEQNFGPALGAVTAGQIELERRGEATVVNGKRLPPVNVFTNEVTTHPMGVTVLDPDCQEERHSVLIQKGVPMPSTQTSRFALAMPGQTDARIEIRQGPDNAPVKNTTLLGKFDLRGMKPVFDGDHGIEIRFQIDRHGMLNAHATDLVSHVSAELDMSTTTSASSVS